MIASDEDCRIVAVGASAGGLESLEELFAHAPAGCGIAFVVIQHLSPDFRSMMDELLARRTTLAIHTAEEGQRVEPDCIYLLPPGKELSLRGHQLRVKDQPSRRGLSLPIDEFFRSLARAVGSRAVAVVLSGSGSDGSRGIRDIRRAGGTVIVESPETAKFDGMPLSALATGVVDHICRPRDVFSVLAGSREHASGEQAPGPGGALSAVLGLLRHQFGVDFRAYKPGTVLRRIERRSELCRAGSLQAYAEKLEDQNELANLYYDLLIGVTEFFRDPEAFTELGREIIPKLIDRVPPQEDLRVWVAACATGEEAYSIAMMILEQLEAAGRPKRLKLMATDPHRASLASASAGLYSEEQVCQVSPERRARFFVREGAASYRVATELRNAVVFAPHNLLEDPPFTRMDLVTCRNLLIYLEPKAQKQVLSSLHFSLVTGGVLMLGSSEHVGELAEEFDILHDRCKLFGKRRNVNLFEASQTRAMGSTLSLRATRPTSRAGRWGEARLLVAYDQLLDRFMAPSFLVEPDLTLIDSFAGAERWLRVSPRRPSQRLVDMLEDPYRAAVSGAVQSVLKHQRAVHYTTLRPDPERPGDARRPRELRVVAEPLAVPGSRTSYVLVTFRDSSATGERERADPNASDAQGPRGDLAESDAERIEQLESELSHARENLQASVEELQTANEELQAANEELVASNEELQSTNEELHSVNEELYTVNAEYQKKIAELNELNSDMQHLLEGTDVGTLFLDSELRIRKYTPPIASVFRILPQDVGRSIRDITHTIERPELLDEIASVLSGGEAIEDEVSGADHATLFLRILPYHLERSELALRDTASGSGSAVCGVVLTVTDISALDAARDRADQLSAIVESSDDAILSKRLDGTVFTWNRGAEQLYGYTAGEMLGQPVHRLAAAQQQAEINEFLAAIARGESVENVETVRERKDGAPLEVSLCISPIRDGDGTIVGASTIARDIAPLKRVQRDLAEQTERMQMLMDSTAESIFGVDLEGHCTFCNQACARMLGYHSPDELLGQPMHALMHHHHADGTPYALRDCPAHAVLRTGVGAHRDQDVLLFRRDGSSFDAEYWSYPVRREGQVEGAVVTFLDVTERKRAEAEIRLAAERREQFLAMLSHELRSPLSAVMSASQLLQHANVDSQKAQRALSVVTRQSAQMARLLDDLLDVSRVTRGKVALRKESIDLREPIQQAVEAARSRQSRDGQVELELDLPDSEIPVEADPSRMQQVATNLLSNALDHSQPGQRVTVRVGCSEGQAVLEVTDRGSGIDPALLPRIFELFVQTDQSIDRSRGGLGVGLTVVREITELHGGRVEAESEGPGRGSVFRVRLPLSHGLKAGKPPRAAGDALASEPRGEGGAVRVLVVEDQEDARETLCMLLEAVGHEVLSAANGEAGLALLERERPDVAIVDVGLPGLSGWQLAQHVRAQPELDAVRLVALTGYGAEDDVRRTLESGFDHHLTKPAQLDKLQAILSVAS